MEKRAAEKETLSKQYEYKINNGGRKGMVKGKEIMMEEEDIWRKIRTAEQEECQRKGKETDER